ncbi:uncharacterized protein [Procambarus clarkii]|uniref:uncharacterized protein n=1 Tax=Procambarus clarkii TaxID=6728 RepID=UPI0037448BA0
MTARTTEGSLFTVGLVSTPAPQHLSTSTTNIPPTYSATFTTTPLQHLDYTLASMSSGYTLPPLPFNAEAAAALAPAYLSSSTCPSTTSPSSPAGVSSLTTCASTTTYSFTTPTSFPRYGTSSTFTGRFTSTRPGVVTGVSRSSLVTPRPPALTSPTITTYTTYNPAINKFSTHLPTTTTTPRYRPSTTTFTARPLTTTNLTTTTTNLTTTTAAAAQDSQIYTLFPHLADSSPQEERATLPPPPRVTLANSATAHRPGPTWPLRVNLSSSEGYDNIDLDLGEDARPPKGQVRTHMTKEQFLAVPQPPLELYEAGDQVRRGWQSAQERLEERRRGGVWSLSLFPTSSNTTFTTTSTTSFTTSFTTTTTSSTTTNGAPSTEGVVNLDNNITTTFSTNGAYCNQWLYLRFSIFLDRHQQMIL